MIYKDRAYIDTIRLIRDICVSAGIEVEEQIEENIPHCYTSRVSLKNLQCIGTNGKGSSIDQSLASAYGEFMERLQNHALYKFSYPLCEIDYEKMEYVYAPDEVFENDLNCERLLWTEDWNDEITEKWMSIHSNKERENQKYLLLSYSDIDGMKWYLPAKYAEHAYGSNGMCAGNTREEAIVQGICEIFERYVNKVILEDDSIVAPLIPIDVYREYTNIQAFIGWLGNAMPGGKVEFRDYSLNKKIPVVGMHLYNGEGSYYIKFGSHPILEVAMERCINELFQGRMLNDAKEWMRCFSWKDIPKEEFAKIFRSGDGDYPHWLFGDKYTYDFKDIWFQNEDKSNVNFLKYVCKVIRANHWDIYIRDTSWLGFPSYQVIIPSVSEINQVDRHYVEKLSDMQRLKLLLRNLATCKECDYKTIYSLLHTYYPGSKLMLSKVLDLPVKQSVLYAFTPCVLLEFYLCLTLNKRDDAEKIMSCVECDDIQSELLRCVRDVYYALRNGVKDYKSILEKFHSLTLIEIARYTIQNPGSFFKMFPIIGCFECESCEVACKCTYPKILGFHKEIVKKIAKEAEEHAAILR